MQTSPPIPAFRLPRLNAGPLSLMLGTQLMFRLRRGRFAIGLCPEAVAGAVNEHVFEGRLADGNRLDLSRKSLDHVGNEAMAIFELDAHLAGEHGGFHRKARVDALC